MTWSFMTKLAAPDADVAGMIFVHLPRILKKPVGSSPAFAICVWSTMYNYCVHKCVQTHAPTVTSGMCGNITGETFGHVIHAYGM